MERQIASKSTVSDAGLTTNHNEQKIGLRGDVDQSASRRVMDCSWENMITQMKKYLLILVDYLGEIPSILFGLLYLLCIPLFALIYNYHADEFFYSTLNRDASLISQRTRIGQIVQSSILITSQQAKRRLRTNDFEAYKGAPRPIDGQTYVQSMDHNADRIIVHGLANFINVDIAPVTTRRYSIELTPIGQLDEDDGVVYWEVFFIDLSESFILPRLPSVSEEMKDLLLPRYGRRERAGEPARALRVSSEEFQYFLRYYRATRGYPSEAEGSYIRMLYLSAVTITTLGYGDIVPTTNRMRALVAFEAVLGIVIIGLFLNSIARRH